MPPVQGLRISGFMSTPEVFVRARGFSGGGGALKLVLPEVANMRAQSVRSYLNAQGVEVAEVIEMNSMMGTLDLIARSDWCAILPALLMATRTYGEVFEVTPLDPPLALELVMVDSAAAALPPAAEAFCEVLREVCLGLADRV